MSPKNAAPTLKVSSPDAQVPAANQSSATSQSVSNVVQGVPVTELKMIRDKLSGVLDSFRGERLMVAFEQLREARDYVDDLLARS